MSDKALVPVVVDHEGAKWDLWRLAADGQLLIQDLEWGRRLRYDRDRLCLTLRSMAERGLLVRNASGTFLPDAPQAREVH